MSKQTDLVEEVEKVTEKPSAEEMLSVLSQLLLNIKTIDASLSKGEEVVVLGNSFSSEKRFYKKLAIIVAEERATLVKDIKKVTESL
jgi:hypothetical protein